MNYENIDIKRRIHEAGLTQIKVAKLLGVTPEYLSRALRTKQIRIDLRKRIECAINGDVYGARKKHKNGDWISVKDRLPEPKINPLTQDFAWVICYCDFGGEPKRTDVRFYGFGKPSWAEKAHFLHGGQVMDGVVTHWMPLPEPPKEDDDAKE